VLLDEDTVSVAVLGAAPLTASSDLLTEQLGAGLAPVTAQEITTLPA
jgi:hypothetical protein